MPPAPRGSVSQQLQQQYAYLFQLAQNLNRAFEQAESRPQAAVHAAAAGQERAE